MRSAPHGHIGIRDDLYFFPFQGADGQHVTLLTTYRHNDRPIWPLRDDAQLWCRGNTDATWSLTQRGHDTEDLHGHVLVLQCSATGSLLNLGTAVSPLLVNVPLAWRQS